VSERHVAQYDRGVLPVSYLALVLAGTSGAPRRVVHHVAWQPSVRELTGALRRRYARSGASRTALRAGRARAATAGAGKSARVEDDTFDKIVCFRSNATYHFI
jgi:hypothetical protein